MQKIPTLFERDWEGDRSRVLDKVTPGCEWVLAGEGAATHKYDGTCVMYDGNRWWARREVRPGKGAPPNFKVLSIDENTGKTVGWEPIEQSPFAKFHTEALVPARSWEEGTYELVGPKINGNPEGAAKHLLVKHEYAETLGIIDRSYEGLRRFLSGVDLEGIVFRRQNGDMAKIKKRDFGMRR